VLVASLASPRPCSRGYPNTCRSKLSTCVGVDASRQLMRRGDVEQLGIGNVPLVGAGTQITDSQMRSSGYHDQRTATRGCPIDPVSRGPDPARGQARPRRGLIARSDGCRKRAAGRPAPEYGVSGPEHGSRPPSIEVHTPEPVLAPVRPATPRRCHSMLSPRGLWRIAAGVA